MTVEIVLTIVLASVCGFLFAAIGSGMAANMESTRLAGIPGAVLGILAGVVVAVRFGSVEIVPLIATFLTCGAIGAAAGCFSTIKQSARWVILSGLLFGLLGGPFFVPASRLGLVIGVLAAPIGGCLLGLILSLRASAQPLVSSQG